MQRNCTIILRLKKPFFGMWGNFAVALQVKEVYHYSASGRTLLLFWVRKNFTIALQSWELCQYYDGEGKFLLPFSGN